MIRFGQIAKTNYLIRTSVKRISSQFRADNNDSLILWTQATGSPPSSLNISTTDVRRLSDPRLNVNTVSYPGRRRPLRPMSVLG